MPDLMKVDEAEQEEEYDEEADSDFDIASGDDSRSISSGDEAENNTSAAIKDLNGRASKKQEPLNVDLDSGDEATINEQSKRNKKVLDKSKQVENEDVFEGWKAKTRSMRAHEKVEKKQKKLASLKTSTIDVDTLWEQMNRPGPLPPVKIAEESQDVAKEDRNAEQKINEDNKENATHTGEEEMITIRRQFKFAGEVHIEEKTVPKTSAEAHLWLSQQEGKSHPPEEEALATTQRPLRKISRFDPNYSNIEAFKGSWTRTPGFDTFKGPKLNVVEKSKMDWAVHVDSAGLQEELAEHAKAKGAYLNRMDFLSEVERRKENEAREARLRG